MQQRRIPYVSAALLELLPAVAVAAVAAACCCHFHRLLLPLLCCSGSTHTSLSTAPLQLYQTVTVNVLMIVVVIPGELIPGAVRVLPWGMLLRLHVMRPRPCSPLPRPGRHSGGMLSVAARPRQPLASGPPRLLGCRVGCAGGLRHRLPPFSLLLFPAWHRWIWNGLSCAVYPYIFHQLYHMYRCAVRAVHAMRAAVHAAVRAWEALCELVGGGALSRTHRWLCAAAAAVLPERCAAAAALSCRLCLVAAAGLHCNTLASTE